MHKLKSAKFHLAELLWIVACLGTALGFVVGEVITGTFR